jgi:hypothetical protein
MSLMHDQVQGYLYGITLGRDTLRGNHSSSNDSRRRYLSDAYLENSRIFEERAHKHNSRGSDCHRGSMFDVSSSLH